MATTKWVFDNEGDTLGVVLVEELNRLPDVTFARYDINWKSLQIQTVGPIDCMNRAIQSLIGGFREILSRYENKGYIIRKENEEELIIDMNCELHLINMIRRVIMMDVETMAIDVVQIESHVSPMNDEQLVHRIGLIPVLADPEKYVRMQDCDCDVGCPFCQIRFQLSVEGKNVYSQHLTSLDTDVMPDIPIVYLKPTEKLSMVCLATKNSPSVHAKWAAASICSVTPKLVVHLSPDFNEPAICPRGVFELTETGRVRVKDVDSCSMCGECKQTIQTIEDWYTLRIETIGQMSPNRIFKAAIAIIEKKLSKYLNTQPL